MRDSPSEYRNVRPVASSGFVWSFVGLAGRQLIIVAFSIALARMLGPDAYGVVAQAAVYMTLTTLLLDQGISAALLSARSVSRPLAGAAATINLSLAAVLGAITFAAAPLMAGFFRTPELTHILWVLAGALLFKGASIVPRLLLARSLNFRRQAVVDVSSAAVGGAVAVIAALGGADYWALVIQTLLADAISAVLLTALARPPVPNFQLRLLQETFGFSSRALGSSLISYTVQNIDNVLVGRFMGAVDLAHYSLGYRVLTTPIQMIGQAVTRVLFPSVARARHTDRSPAPLIARSITGISLITFPAMALVAVSSSTTVPLLLGDSWEPVIPVLSVLAISGARQSVTTVNTAVMLGMGRADVTLRFSLVAATVQISGIIIGLQFGILGVAAGLTLAGFLVTPIIAVLQKRIADFPIRAQILAVIPALHGTAWAIAVYLLLGLWIEEPWTHLVLGTSAGVAVYAIVLLFAHRSAIRLAARALKFERAVKNETDHKE
ncbi:hypothetical protein DEJ23_06355 [Curtobacterium sp. MCSS17_008]|uniref:lipopolysaccharide biosynthesis protein n=1 Tax=Curtobacterium sp. MCSS17_008 TaxID=2175647 RepID=UPI000DAA3275|nr:lipopolysaccharide biosynthesis protein [Curtobacterium sp. MCSS17_008]PZF57759.1 hypothetical protein DEJ23_06355 [Curtobacterium sp. MCSS17_008]